MTPIRPLAISLSSSLVLGLAIAPLCAAQEATPGSAPPIASMSALAFTPEGVLLVGDAQEGAVFAVELGERAKATETREVDLADVETRIGALIGARASDVVVHDLAVDPVALDIYLAVSRNRGRWRNAFDLPNDLGNATELVRIHQNGRLEGVDLAGRAWTRALLPKPIAPGKKHIFKDGVDPRTEAITDLAWDEGTIWVAGLSNEEFSSAIWRVPYPFTGASAAVTTVENYHVAHRAWETESPVRTLLPHRINGRKVLIAAYLCTPLVIFETDQLKDGAHVKGRTIAEFGSGNYPLDMVRAQSAGKDRVFLANSNLPALVVTLDAIDRFEGALTEPVDSYTAGLVPEYRSGVSLQQLDNLGERHLVALRRLPGGTLDLETWALRP